MSAQQPPASGPAEGMQRHILSIDVEEYFHVESAAGVIGHSQWDSFATRLEGPVDRILALLAEHRQCATFFVLGQVAMACGGMVRRIVQAGHEVASHGQNHVMVMRQSPQEFRNDVRESKALLEDITGQAVTGYRAPTFSITLASSWALDVLAQEGYRYDSSVFPVRHDRYGVHDAPRGPHWASGPRGGKVLELPPLTLRMMGSNWPCGGGGYLRLLPAWMISKALSAWGRQGRCGMIYLHPWELDPHQPPLPMGRLALWRHRVNLHKTQHKLHYLLDKYSFTSASSQFDQMSQTVMEQFTYRPRPLRH